MAAARKAARRSLHAQSAMEYLMTYGWAILIIAVVLGALFSLGVFNTTGPRAQAGSCQVYRPFGPYTNGGSSLAGACNGEIPQYVGNFDGNPRAQFVELPNTMSEVAYDSPFTISAWINRGTIPALEIDNIFGNAINNGVTNGKGLQFFTDAYNTNNGQLCVMAGASGTIHQVCANGATVPEGSFHDVAVTYDGSGNFLFYVDGVEYAGGYTALQFSPNNNDGGSSISNAAIGARSTQDSWGSFYGRISNVQVYNSTLSATEAKALYQEGIGGAPVKPQNLVAWWPLNGDTKDYSGNENSGTAVGISFTSSWTNGYTAP